MNYITGAGSILDLRIPLAARVWFPTVQLDDPADDLFALMDAWRVVGNDIAASIAVLGAGQLRETEQRK